ncbi:MAG: carotenoid oxygenase family protein [Anaerolineae bacterium]|nr:carotenoid oxygenase family protein [Anaerolineae bacterium]
MTLRNDVVNFAMETEANPYLMGGYAPVHTEITADDLVVIGEIPRDLNGVYVRNGPNPQYQPMGRYHWFDGDGMLHAVHIHDGKVTYRNRWVRTEGYEREAHAGAPIWTGIIEPLTANPRRAPLKDTANTDVVYHNQKLLALWYLSGDPYAVDPITLETLGKETFDGKRPGHVSAHAKVDERTGELIYFDYGPRPPYMTYGVVGPNGQLKHFVPIDLPGARMPHDMAITEHYSILLDLPLIADPSAAREGRHKIVFRRDLPSRFGVIPRYGEANTIRWFEGTPCYMYHTVNAWEDGDEVVLDTCRVAKPAPPDTAVGRLEKMLAYLRLDAQIYRYRFNLRTGQTREERLDDANTEFPTMNTRCLGLQTRYAYNVHISPEKTLLFDGILKYDTQQGTSRAHWFGPHRYGSESPFAPRPHAQTEDDGYLLSFVYDAREDRSELLILNAREISDEPLARVLIPQRVPIGFHACWVPEERLPQPSA